MPFTERKFPFRGPKKTYQTLRDKEARRQKKFESRGNPPEYLYTWIDSAADGALIDAYSSTFLSLAKEIDPECKTLHEFITKSLSPITYPRIGIDIGGAGKVFFRSFPDGFFSKTSGMALETFGISPSGTHDIQDGIDAYSPTFKKRVDSFRAKTPVSLSVSRMARGLDHAPDNPMQALENLDALYARHGTPSVMLIQVPQQYNSILQSWKRIVDSKPNPQLKIACRIGRGYDGNAWAGGSSSALIIMKLPGAPKKLPAVSPREIYRPKN